MIVSIELTSEQESEIARQALENGLAPDDYLQALLGRTISTQPPPPTRPRYDRAAMLTLLDELETDHEKYGTPEEQRQTLDHLKKVIDADRPGQRSIFGEGQNPA